MPSVHSSWGPVLDDAGVNYTSRGGHFIVVNDWVWDIIKLHYTSLNSVQGYTISIEWNDFLKKLLKTCRECPDTRKAIFSVYALLGKRMADFSEVKKAVGYLLTT